MGPIELLRRLVTELEGLELPYLITGSTATILYGEARLTNDIDVVVRLNADDAKSLCAVFPSPEFYVSEESALRAVARCGQFNVIHPASGMKVDVIVAGVSAFEASRFARRRRLRPADDLEAYFASPEDVILKKLVFYREGGSSKHLRDIAGVLRVGGDELDLDYVRGWAHRLEVEELWEEIAKGPDFRGSPESTR